MITVMKVHSCIVSIEKAQKHVINSPAIVSCSQEGDYPTATQLCLECQSAIETYKHFTCVRY